MALIPLLKAVIASGPGGTTRGEPDGEPEEFAVTFDMVRVSMMVLPQVGT